AGVTPLVVDSHTRSWLASTPECGSAHPPFERYPRPVERAVPRKSILQRALLRPESNSIRPAEREISFRHEPVLHRRMRECTSCGGFACIQFQDESPGKPGER